MAQSGTAISRRLLLGGVAALALPSLSRAAGPLDGRRIAFLIGNEGGGNYERYARAFAKYLGLALPGSRITVETVPTADGRLAAKRIAAAPAGDLTIGLFEPALLYSEIAADDVAPVSLADFNWIGKLAVDEEVLIAGRASGIASLKDLAARTEPAVCPGSTVVSKTASDALILNALLGLPIKSVPGYNGAQRQLALLSGEGQVIVGAYASQAKLFEAGEAVVLLRLNEVRNPSAPPSVPLLRDLAGAGAKDLVDLIETSDGLGRWIAAPPATTPDDLAALRGAFDQVVADAAFLAEAKTLKLPIEPLGGVEVQSRVRALLARKDVLRSALQTSLACGRARAAGARAC